MRASVRPAARADAGAWLSMREALWPDGAGGEHEREIEEYFSGRSREPLAVLIAEDSDGRPLGMAELSIRPCAEGCRSGRVAYLEGWFVAPGARLRGVGRLLIDAAQAWARTQSCSELASDTQPNDTVSVAAHRAVGFADAGLIQCFRKDL